jgi:hypothetical protein
MNRKNAPSTQASIAFDPFAAFKPMVPVASMGAVWYNRAADLAREITTFAAERVKQNVEAQHALLQCKSLTQVQHVQAEFLQIALDQYQVETGKVIEIVGRMAADLQVGDKTAT